MAENNKPFMSGKKKLTDAYVPPVLAIMGTAGAYFGIDVSALEGVETTEQLIVGSIQIALKVLAAYAPSIIAAWTMNRHSSNEAKIDAARAAKNYPSEPKPVPVTPPYVPPSQESDHYNPPPKPADPEDEYKPYDVPQNLSQWFEEIKELNNIPGTNQTDWIAVVKLIKSHYENYNLLYLNPAIRLEYASELNDIYIMAMNYKFVQKMVNEKATEFVMPDSILTHKEETELNLQIMDAIPGCQWPPTWTKREIEILRNLYEHDENFDRLVDMPIRWFSVPGGATRFNTAFLLGKAGLEAV